MKKVTALILCIAMLLAIVPASLAAPEDITQSTPVKIRQYGEEDTLVSDSDGLVGRIAYPVGNIEDIDSAILTWASLTMQQWRKDTESATADKDGIKGILSVDFESHEHEGRFVGIEEFGTVTTSGKKEPEYLYYTYNYDLLLSKPLTLFEVVGEEHIAAVIALVEKGIAEQGITLTNVDGALTKDDMQQFVIRDDGIGWLFTGEAGIVGVLLSYDKLDKYLCMYDASPEPEPEDAPDPTGEITIEQTAICLSDGSHIRAEADQDAKLIATINANTELQVIKSNVTAGWHEIWYKNQSAYIAASLVKLEKQNLKTTAGYVVSNSVHIRAGAGTQYKLVGTLHYQDKVDILQKNVRSNWHKILFNGLVAYVCADYISDKKPGDEPDPSATPAPSGPVEIKPKLVPFGNVNWSELGTCTTNGVIVRSRESTRSDYYGKLRAGLQVYIIQYGDTWCQVYVPQSNNTGYIGYVHTKYFDITTPDVPPAQQRNPKTVIGIA